METLEIIVSKANSIRFADNNGLLPTFDNRLSGDEVFFSKPQIVYEQTFFQNDDVLIQVKAGLTATVLLKQHFESGTITTITADDTTTYDDFKIYDYLVSFSTLEKFFFNVTSESSDWISECINVVESDLEYLFIQWSNLDLLNDTFEFDYTTTLSEANVNYMRIRGQLFTYNPSGETTIYDNQNEKTRLKSVLFRGLGMQAEAIPRQIAEIITIATQHDLFLINNVGYMVEDLPDIEPFGSLVQITVELILLNSLGLNTSDIGFICDAAGEVMVENYKQENAAGSGSFSITAGFGVTQIIAKKISGTPILKVGDSVGGDEISMEREVTNTTPPKIINVRYVPDSDGGAWTCYYNVSGGIIDIQIQTIRFTPVT